MNKNQFQFLPLRIHLQRFKSWICAALVLATFTFFSTHVVAQSTYNWIGSGQSEEFFDINSNWLQNAVPGPNDIAQFHISFAIPITINFDSDVTVNELQVLESDYTYRGFDSNPNQPTIFDTNLVEILGEAKLSLIPGPNDERFFLRADHLDLAGAMNVTSGTIAEIDTMLIDADEVTDPAMLIVSGQQSDIPSMVDTNELVVGSDDFGRVEIGGGAVVDVAGDTELGLFGGRAELSITGTNDASQPSRLATHNFIGSADTLTTVTGQAELFVNNILLTQENPAEPGLVEVSTPQAHVQIGNELRLNGGNFSLANGATLQTNKTTAQQMGEGFGHTTSQLNIQSTAASPPSLWINSGDAFVGGTDSVANENGGGIDIDGGIAVIGGTLKLWNAGRLSIVQTNNTSSQLFVESIDNTLGGEIDLSAGSLSVNLFVGNFEQIGGTLAPGDDMLGNLPGSTVIAGNYFQHPSSTLAMDINGTTPIDQHDIVDIGGFMFAAGQLELTMSNSFQPESAEHFILVSAANIIGEFENVAAGGRLMTTDGSGSFRVDYGFSSPFNPSQIILSDFLENNFLLGDINGDGAVNLLDVTPFIQLISSGTYEPQADINGDGNVDLLDVEPFVDLLLN